MTQGRLVGLKRGEKVRRKEEGRGRGKEERGRGEEGRGKRGEEEGKRKGGRGRCRGRERRGIQSWGRTWITVSTSKPT